ncbi:hypothetical protein T439DRAFT_324796 [Meredithblackwellia eburnea MCA 4105]
MSVAESRQQSTTSKLVQRELGKASKLIQEDATAVGSLAHEAVISGAYFYPIRGIIYFLTHPKLFEAVWPIIMKSITMSATVVALMTFFTYLPQVAFLAIISGPLAFIAAIPAVLAESWVIIQFINKAFYIKDVSDKIFDAVLAQKGYADLVEKGRSVRKSGGGIVLGKSLLRPISSRFSTEGLIRYIVTLPLNAIPAVGTLFFLGYNGQTAGPAYHGRYFALKGMSKQERNTFVQQRRGAYTSFGAVSLALGLVPVIGTVFSFSSAAGAALWAADLEKGARGTPSSAGAKETQVAMGRSDEL